MSRTTRSLLLACLLTAPLPIEANESPNPEALLNGLAGSWEGALEYLDYQANEWRGIPMAVDVEVTPDGANRIQRARFTDPGVLVYIVSVSALREGGTVQDVAVFRKGSAMVAEQQAVKIAKRPDADDRWTIVFETKGSDDDRPAMIRETTTRDRDSLVTVKAVDYLDDDGDEWVTRNRIRLKRKGE